MQVTEFRDRRRRCVVWGLPDHGWEDVARQFDPFLASAIQGIAVEYTGEPVAWLEINHWPDTGRLMVFPAQDGPEGNRAERVYFELSSNYLENEFLRRGAAASTECRARAWEELVKNVWEQVENCLCHGQASRQLAEARKVHRFRLAAFDYNFGEGLFHLTELDREASAEMQKELEKFKRMYGVGG
jgi:hypothetical protein